VGTDRGICCTRRQVDLTRAEPVPVHRDDTNPYRLRTLRAERDGPAQTTIPAAFDAQRSAGNPTICALKLLRINGHPAATAATTVPRGTCSSRQPAKTRRDTTAIGLATRSVRRGRTNDRRHLAELLAGPNERPKKRTCRGPAPGSLAGGSTSRRTTAGRTAWPDLPYGGPITTSPPDYGAPFYCAKPGGPSRPHKHRTAPTCRRSRSGRSFSTGRRPRSPSWAPAASGRWAGPAYDYDGNIDSGSMAVVTTTTASRCLLVDGRRLYVRSFHHRAAQPCRDDQAGASVDRLDNPMDMSSASDGALYALEYGDGFLHLREHGAQLAGSTSDGAFGPGNRRSVGSPTVGSAPVHVTSQRRHHRHRTADACGYRGTSTRRHDRLGAPTRSRGPTRPTVTTVPR